MTGHNQQLIEEYRQNRVQQTAKILQQVDGDPDPAIETLHAGAKQIAIEKKRGSLAPASEEQDQVKHVEQVDPVAKMAAERQGGGSGTPVTAPELQGAAHEETATKF